MLYICILSNKFDLKQTIRVLHTLGRKAVSGKRKASSKRNIAEIRYIGLQGPLFLNKFIVLIFNMTNEKESLSTILKPFCTIS